MANATIAVSESNIKAGEIDRGIRDALLPVSAGRGAKVTDAEVTGIDVLHSFLTPPPPPPLHRPAPPYLSRLESVRNYARLPDQTLDTTHATAVLTAPRSVAGDAQLRSATCKAGCSAMGL